MYGALWRVLPGPVWVRILLVLVLLVAVVFALFTWVFPWVDADHQPASKSRWTT